MQKNNLLINGLCGVPGIVKGRTFIWGKNVISEFERGDIIIILPGYHAEIPLSYISLAHGVISCQHTLYSHLVSATMAFNIPCIVGATFLTQPREFCYIFMDAISKFVTLDIEMNFSSYILDNHKILRRITSAIIDSGVKKPLAHLYNVNMLDDYKEYISGFFIDSNMIQSLDDCLLINSIKSISNFCQQTNVNVYYRFSKNPVYLSKCNITKEIDFICELFRAGVNLSLFFPNAESYNDIIEFREYVTQNFFEFLPFKIGSMIEDKNMVNDLERILNDHLIDFAIIGMNDLLSSILGLERDDAKNGLDFSVSNSKVNNILKLISQKCKDSSIPFFISFPKFDNFLSDFACLMEAGYNQFFGSLSLFKILKAYEEQQLCLSLTTKY